MGLRLDGYGPPKVMKMDPSEVRLQSEEWKRSSPLWSS
jgi:hypothetical protein